MSELDVTYIGAAGAGLLSFLSPCVLPLVPAYLCFLGGVSLEELTEDETGGTEQRALSARVLLAALAFVVGFSVVFVSFGATASALSQLIFEYKLILGKIAGVVIVLFGLHFMGLFRLAFLNREARFHPERRPAGLAGAFLIGLAFAFGWTPCIGPVLATVLSVAAQSDSVTYGTTLLAAYAAGLGVPFLLAAFLAKPFMRLMTRFRRHMAKVEFAVGGLLVVTGLLFIFNSFEILGLYLLEAFPILAEIG
jgi:cytochrome c-type biogenesis protein